MVGNFSDQDSVDSRLLQGTRLYTHHINAQGGIWKKPLFIVTHNKASSVDRQIDSMNHYVESNPLILSLVSSVYECNTLTQYYTLGSDSPVFLFPILNINFIDATSPLFFFLTASYHNELEQTFRLMKKKLKEKSITLIIHEKDLSISSEFLIKKVAKRHHISISSSFYMDSIDAHSKHIIELLSIEKPSDIYLVSDELSIFQFIEMIRNVLPDVTIYLSSSTQYDQFLTELTAFPYSTQVRLSRNIINIHRLPLYHDQRYHATRLYHSLCQKNNVAPTFNGFHGFLNTRLLHVILKQLPPLVTKQSLIQSLLTGTHYSIGIDQDVWFSQSKRFGLKRVYFSTYRDGHIIPLNLNDDI